MELKTQNKNKIQCNTNVFLHQNPSLTPFMSCSSSKITQCPNDHQFITLPINL